MQNGQKAEPRYKKIGILTSGGDAPGMNACIYAAVKAGAIHGVEVVGIKDGFRGLVQMAQEKHKAMLRMEEQAKIKPPMGKRVRVSKQNPDFRDRGVDLSQDRYWSDLQKQTIIPLHERDLNAIIRQGGTMLGTARCPEFFYPEGRELAYQTLVDEGIEALIVVGGDGSFTGAMKLSKEHNGYPVNCVPATIDNDLECTDYTVGFNSAVRTLVENIENIRDTMRSHKRTGLVIAMGNFCGDIADMAGKSSGADIVLLPPKKGEIRENQWELQLDELMSKWAEVVNRGVDPTLVVLAEGCLTSDDYFFPFTRRLPDDSWDKMSREFRYVPLGKDRPLMTEMEFRFMLEKRLQQVYPDRYSLRTCRPAYIQRGGRPTVQDRMLAEQLTNYAFSLLMAGEHGYVACTRNNADTKVTFEEALNMQTVETRDPTSAM